MFKKVINQSTIVLLLLASLTFDNAFAHTGEGGANGFLAGVMHPISGFDHLLAMVSIGIWGATLGRPLVWVLPVAFPMMMVVGGILGIAGIPLPYIEPGIAGSVVVLGLAIAAAWRAPLAIAIAIVAVFGVFHGYAHGAELPSSASPAEFVAGFVICTGTLHIAGIGLGFFNKFGLGRKALRAAGAAIAASGVWIFFGMPGLV
jgi:urease accessory protein